MENFDMENAKPASGNYGKIITTPEAIVREHRERWAKRSAYAQGATARQERRFLDEEINRIDRRLMISTLSVKCRRLINRVNWNVAIEWLCWGLVILALAAIIGVVVFGPTSWREFWK